MEGVHREKRFDSDVVGVILHTPEHFLLQQRSGGPGETHVNQSKIGWFGGALEPRDHGRPYEAIVREINEELMPVPDLYDMTELASGVWTLGNFTRRVTAYELAVDPSVEFMDLEGDGVVRIPREADLADYRMVPMVETVLHQAITVGRL